MKKFFITMFAFCFVQFFFGQNIKSIRVNNSTQMYNQAISIHDIDSITYDIDTQSQIVHTKNGIESYSLFEVDSLSFSYEEAVNALFTQEYLKDATTCLFSNGWVLSVSTDSLSNNTINIDLFDFATKSWEPSKSLIIYCDSLGRPILAQNELYTYYFSNYDGDSFDLKVVKPDGGEIIVEDVLSHIPQKARTRANWTQEINSTIDEINGALFMYDNIDAIYNPTPIGIGTTIASWINNLFLPSGTSQDAMSWGISAIATLFAPGAVAYTELTLSTKQLILSKAREEAEKRIGKCTAHISKVSCKNGNTAVINFDISGISSYSIEQACYQINYWAIVNGKRTNIVHTTEWKYAENGSKSIDIPNLSGGKYGFQLIIFPRSLAGHYNLINLFKIPSNVEYLDIDPIYIEEIKQDYTTYSDDNVTVSMKVKLKFMSEQDQTILQYYDSYGLYYKYDNNVSQRDNYISAKENGGLVFYVTLDIPKDEFSCDYNNFVATCADKITFMTYTIDGWGIKAFYDEQDPKIVYDKKPKVETGEKMSVGKTSAFVNCSYEGCGFWDIPCGIEYGYEDIIERDLLTAKFDGEQVIHLTDLSPGKTYTYRAYYEANGQTYYGGDKFFTTEWEPDPVATTGDCISSNTTSATVRATYTNVPTGAECGISYYCYDDENTTRGTSRSIYGGDQRLGRVEGEQIVVLNDLLPGKEYYYNAYILYNNRSYEGEERVFTTSSPEAWVNEVNDKESDITCTAIYNIPYGFNNVPEYSSCHIAIFAEGEENYIYDNVENTNEDIYPGFDNLLPDTQYYYFAFIGNDQWRSNIISFKTKAPSATLIDIIEIQEEQATIKYSINLVPEGAATYIQLVDDNGNKLFYEVSSNQTELTAGSLKNSTHYTATLIIEFAEKVWNSNSLQFTTKSPATPVATTGDFSNVTMNSATVTCTYENVPEGGVCGVEYTWNDGSTKQTIGSSNGTQSITLSDLNPATFYTYCAYIEANGQTYYGSDKSFTTDTPNLAGTWNCTITKGKSIESWEITLTEDHKGSAVNTDGNNSTIYEASWSVGADGKASVGFSYVISTSSYYSYQTYNLNGLVDNLLSPSQIQGEGWYEIGNAIAETIVPLTFSMSK